jgi:hypothetical protein
LETFLKPYSYIKWEWKWENQFNIKTETGSQQLFSVMPDWLWAPPTSV